MKDIDIKIENHAARIVLKGQDITDLVSKMYIDRDVLHLEIPLKIGCEISSG